MILKETIEFTSADKHPDSEWRTLCIDFDGVLCDSKGPYGWGHFGPPEPEGLKLLRMAIADGFYVTILTARKETDLVAQWLEKQGFPNMVVTNHKVPALAYVDDRAVPWGTGKTKAEAVLKLIKNPKRLLKLKV